MKDSRRNKQTNTHINKQTNTHIVDLKGIFDTPASKKRLKIFAEFRRINEESYNSELDRQPKVERLKIIFALLIINKGNKSLLSIHEVAERSGLTRSTIHKVYGEAGKESALVALYHGLLSDVSDIIIRRFHDLSDYFAGASPIEKIERMFQALLSALREMPEAAMASFLSLSLLNEEERRIVAPAFDLATKLIQEAREKQLLNEAAKTLKDSQITHLLFYACRGAILAGLGEGVPPAEEEGVPPAEEKEFLSNKAAYKFVLMNLKIFVSEEAAKLIDKRISETGE